MSQVMITKLLPPRFFEDIIERPRLIKLLSQNPHRRLTILCAPAGYGKSILTLQFVTGLKKPFVWYQLDETDNDPAVFIQYLLAGVQCHFPDFGEETSQLVLQGNVKTHLRLLVTSLVNELAGTAPDGLILVLNDFHLISESVIQILIQDLLCYLPSGSGIVITSRAFPTLPVSRLRISGEMTMVSAAELRFTREEIQSLLAKHALNFSQEQIAALENRTNGWPVAVKSFIDAALKTEPSFIFHDTKMIYEYLASEVLEKQQKPVYEFLLGTSVLETLTPESCDSLLKRGNALETLEWLEKQQLFITRVGETRHSYRYHQLFRDFLMERTGSQKDPLKQRTEKVFTGQNDFDNTTESFFTAGFEQDLIPVHASPESCSFKTSNHALLRLYSLGRLRIFWGETEITNENWRSTKARDLLLYLSYQEEPVSLDRILEDLWPEISPVKGRDIFYTTLHRLRQIVNREPGTEMIQYKGKRCQLLPGKYITDRCQFIRLASAGLNAEQNTCETKVRLEEAAALYHGDYFADLDYPWLIPEREHLKRLYLEIKLRLGRFYIRNNEYAKTVNCLDPLVPFNLLHEEIHCLLMMAYTGLGDRLAVIRQYNVLKKALEEELGLEPAPETKKLYDKVCRSQGARHNQKT